MPGYSVRAHAVGLSRCYNKHGKDFDRRMIFLSIFSPTNIY